MALNLSELKSSEIKNLDLLAKQVVEGFITGMHKSPYHGFSVEFSEHKLYNKGEDTKHIDWKLFAKTEKLYTKKYEEETNLRCHIIIDNSSSMHYPLKKEQNLNDLNKIGFSVVAAACLIELLKKQRDAVGLSIYSNSYEYYAPEKGSDRHRKMLTNQLEILLKKPKETKTTDTYQYLHEIAQKIHRRSMIFLFTDMFQPSRDNEELFDALRHLKYNKHEVILFHTFDRELEYNFDFENTPKKFVDVETGEQINLYANSIKESYQKEIGNFFENLKNKCLQYKINYVPVNVRDNYNKILTTYLVSRNKF
ncbi:hypothetical protein BTO06_13860 [Tenacibaculum sp. SZ-18]|uniref:DUF58 domain-containing protein n=1 Tax=Tenacibaculum sp. SZ-18 TaxID=754423 RepID=UPI000C2D0AA4|nr:DUF58 domain-containing protein [Tenacibaculum sp. SZ-18]AUC16180.1 hypothetical protein BTO06_13860 [Tenacibaculum sp. SZ-18]